MNWHLKAGAFKVLSTVPGGRAFYDFSRKRLTHSLVPTRARVSQKIEVAEQYFNWLAAHQEAKRLLNGVHLDFGAGWHPTIPLFLYALGVERQYLFDVAPLLDTSLLRQTVHTFRSLIHEPQFPQRTWLQRTPPPFEQGAWQDYFKSLGFSYHAPYAAAFPSLAGQVDVVTSTQVLLHVPRAAVPGCFGQIHQSLRPGGFFLATLYLRDILTGCTQAGLVKYQQLQYSPQSWERWFNSALMPFNRLRAPDYKAALEVAGFEIVHFEVEPGTAQELKELEQVRLAECFRHYRPEDLAARHLFFVARKA